MPSALFRFRQRIESDTDAGIVLVNWLPRGQADAITVSVHDESSQTLIWFEPSDGQGLDPHDIDVSIVFGEIQFGNLSEEDLALLREPHQLSYEDSDRGRRYRTIVKTAVNIAHEGVSS